MATLLSGTTIGGNSSLHAGNYSSYALPLTGGTVSGATTFSANVDLQSTGTKLPGHFYTNTYDGSNVYFHVGTSSSTNKILNLRVYDSANNFSLYAFDTAKLNAPNLQVNGNQVIHAGNYTSYPDATKLPLAGGALTGTISIDTSGSSGSTSSVILKRSGQSIVNFGSYSGAWRSALQIQSNASDRLLFFVPPEADYQYSIFRSVNGGLKVDVGGTTSTTGTNAISIETSGAVTMPVSLNVTGAITQSSNQVLHAGNYSSYALPISGGTLASSTDGILALNKSSGSSWNYIEFKTSGTRRFYFGLNASAEPELGVDNSTVFRVLGGMTIAGNTVIHAGNYTSYAPGLGTSNTYTNTNFFRSNVGSGVYIGSASSPPLQAFSNDGGAAFMSFHRNGSYAVNLGLDPDNVLRIGGWSASSNRWQLDMSGNETLAGTITATGATLTGLVWGGLPLAPNLIHNSYMSKVTSGVPDGYSVLGSITITAVHPFTKAFEGPYTASAPAGSVNDPELATQSTPYWFGVYQKGPRIGRGGMGDGWHSYSDGNILKVSATGLTASSHCAIYMPKDLNMLGATWLFSCFVKIVKGTYFTVGSDAGYSGGNTGYNVSKTVTDAGSQGWYRFSTLLGTSQITSIDGLAISMAVLPDATGAIEAYIALPYLANVTYKGTNQDSWAGSVIDNLMRNGVYINPSTQSVTLNGTLLVNNDSGVRASYDSGGSYAWLYGYGVEFGRSTSYVRPNTNRVANLWVGGSSINSNDWANIDFYSSGRFSVNNNAILHAGNYNSYALPLTGGTLSGVLYSTKPINVTGATYNTQANYVGNWSGAGWWGLGSESGHIIKFDQVAYADMSAPTWIGATDITLKLGTKTVLDSTNASYAWNLNQNLRTIDSPTLAVLQLTRLNFGSTGTTPYSSAAGEGFGNGITFGGDENSAYYRIFTGMENYGGNYSKLTLNWHTGIRIGAYVNYGGVRFYNNAVGTGSEIFSVGKGDSHVRVENYLIVGGYLNVNAGTSENPTIGNIWTQNTSDNYLRKSTPAHFRSQVTDGVYVPFNPDGDGVCIAYSDQNPTFNGVQVGGGWYFGADGSTTGGALTAKILNAYGGGVNSTNGYYVGNNDFLANSNTTTTNQVIDSSRNFYGASATFTGAASIGSTVTYSNRKPIYTIFHGGAQDLAWKKIADVTLASGLYQCVTFKVDVLDNQGNFGWNSDCYPMTYFVSFRRSGGVQDDYNDAFVTGPVADYVRAVKTATGVYELQIRQLADWQTYIFTAEATIGTATINYAAGTPPNGSTTGTIYTASAGWTQKLAKLIVAGTSTFSSAVSINSTLAVTGIITTVSSGTAINFSGQSDSIGYNATAGLGTYIKGTGVTYVYGGGSFYDGSAQRALLHAGNYSSYALPLSGGAMTGSTTISGDNHMTFGPNSSWGSSIRIGGNGYTATGTEMASVVTTDGNLHLDAAKSSNGIYLNWYGGTNGTYFGNGSSSQVGRVDASGNASFSGAVTSTYGSFGAPGLIVGDAQYGLYTNSGNLYYKSASTGIHYWRNIANSANTMALDNSGNLTITGALSATGAITQNGNQVLHAGNYISSYIAPEVAYTTATNASGYTWIRIPYASGDSFNSGQSPIEFYVTRSIYDNSSTPYGGPTAKFVIQSQEWHSGEQLATVQYSERGDSASSGAANWITNALVVNQSGAGYWIYMRLRTGTSAGITYRFRRAAIGGQGLGISSIESTTDPGNTRTLYAGFNLISAGGGARFYRDGNVVLDAGNSPYAYNMNQNVRTTDSPTFASLTITSEITIQKYNARNLLIKGVGSSDCGILGRGSSDQFAFQLYGDGGGQYGFLDGAWAGWDLKKVVDGNLYLNDNTSYYLNPASTTYLSNLIFDGASSSDYTRQLAPGGGYFYEGGSVTGAIKIRLPANSKTLYPMLSFTCHIYNYGTGTSRTFKIGGHFSSTSWYNPFVYCLTENGANLNVRWGYEGNYLCVWIGETNSGWSYPCVFITDFQNGYSAINSSWMTGWSVSRVTAFDTVTNGPTAAGYFWNQNNDGSGSGLDADLVDGLEVHTGRNDNANKIVRTDSNGYIQAGWINTTSGDNGTTAIDRVYASSDAYIRYYTPANFRTVLDVPTRSGGGASGTWAINVTGSSYNASYASSAGSASSAGYLTGGDSNFYALLYNALSGDLNTYNSAGLYSAEYTGSTNKPSGFGNGHFIQISDAGGTDVKTQWYTVSDGSKIGMRIMWGNGNWQSWRTLLTDSSTSAPNLVAGNATSISSALSESHTWISQNYFRSNKGPGTVLGGQSDAQLQAYSTDAGPAFMSFHRSGYYAVNMGLDPDNVFRIGGWSASGNRLQLDMSGNLEVAGSMTAADTIKIFPPYSSPYSTFLRMGYDTSGSYEYSIKRNGTTGYLEFNGTQAGYISYVFANGNVYCGDSSATSGGFYFNSSSHGLRRASGTNDVYLFTTSGTLYMGGGGSSTTHMRITSTGSVGVGVSPSYTMDVNGSCHATCFPVSSDKRFKKKIKPLENSLEKIKKVNGVSYEWNEFVNERRNGYDLNSTIIGVIAQDVEEVLPEIVTRWRLSDDCTDARAVDYSRFIPVLIEAIKEQQSIIENQNEKINNLIARMAALESKIA